MRQIEERRGFTILQLSSILMPTKKKARYRLFAWAICIILTLSSVSVFGTGTIRNNTGAPSDGLNYVSHAPIRIDSNTNFNSANGVTGGNGSPQNPYIIENYEINGSGNTYCIYISNTNAHFIIRNCNLHEAYMVGWPHFEYYEYGIRLSNVQNGVITNTTTEANDNYGIYMENSANNKISYNNCSMNFVGGIKLLNCSNNILSNSTLYSNKGYDEEVGLSINGSFNTIMNNTIQSSYCGVLITGKYNTIENNLIQNNDQYGIFLNPSSGSNGLCNNTISNNWDGMCLLTSSNNTISNNTFISNMLGGIGLSNFSSGNFIINNTISSSAWSGIGLSSSNNNTITNNNASNNQNGISIFYSNDNIIARNNISNNKGGISIGISSSNTIFHNNLINNTYQAWDDSLGNNSWDNGYPSGGNYWSDYSGFDILSGPGQNKTGSDGIGDIPYFFTSAQDDYPLMTPWHFIPPLEITILLSLGWNLVSISLEMTNTSIPNVLASISGQWDVVKYYDTLDKADPWKTYRVGSSMNDLLTIDNTMGIWIHATISCNLTMSGLIPISTSIPLYAGWNLVGYPTQTTETVGNALWGTGADRVEKFDAISPYFISEVGPSYIMKPGEGYWVHVPADTIWTVIW